MDVQTYIHGVGRRARAAARSIARADTATKNRALKAMAAAIERDAKRLLEANARDLEEAKRNKLDPAMVDRLTLTAKGIAAMADGLRQIAALPDPIGRVTALRKRPSGIRVGRMRVPLGVVAIIYESRPNVTADAAGLCVKSGNAAILRGGSEAIQSNQAIAACVHAGLKTAGLPEDVVQVIEITDRAAVGELVTMRDTVDVIVPRGGKSLIERLMRESRIPMIKHLHGVCHTYIDDKADLKMAIRVADNAKTQRLGTCNTMETLLVARGIARKVLPPLCRIYAGKGIELRGDDEVRRIVPGMKPATEDDWYTEYLDAILSVRVVKDLDEAMEHIANYGSQHTDAIVTEDPSAAEEFLRRVDSAGVFHNASTRFADGYRYGLGAEVGISTQKIHARGPVGLEGLVIYKYVLKGRGQGVGDYGPGKRRFLHRPLDPPGAL